METGEIIFSIIFVLIALGLTVLGAYLTIQGIKNGNVVMFVIGINMFATCFVGLGNIILAIGSMAQEKDEEIVVDIEDAVIETEDEMDYSEAGDVENAELAY